MKATLHTAAKITLVILVSIIYIMPAGAARGDKYAEEFGDYPGYAGASYEGLTTESLYITMRDGVKIAIDINLP